MIAVSDSFLAFWHGYYLIHGTGDAQPWRLWNMCKHHNIILWKIRERDACYDFCISKKQYPLFLELTKKTCGTYTIRKEYGMPRYGQLFRHHLSLYLSVLLGFFLIIFLSLHIWSIRINGNSRISKQEVMRYLDSIEIYHGILSNKIGCTALADNLRKEFSDIAWVAVRISGTCLYIDIQENILVEEDEENNSNISNTSNTSNNTPYDLVAKKDCQIVSIITRTGVPQVHPGDLCKKGDVLVSGAIPIVNDAGETIRYEYVQADADIQMVTTYAYYDQIKRRHSQRTIREISKEHYFLRLGSYYIQYPTEKGMLMEYVPFYLTESFELPFGIGKYKQFFYQESTVYEDPDQTRQQLLDRMDQYLGKLEKKGVQIYENNVKIDISDADGVAKGTLDVLEQAVTQAKTEQILPEERNTNIYE